jgi:hypothetical protein
MKHYINGVEITPRNNDELAIMVDFNTRTGELEINTDVIVLPNEGRTIIEQHIQTQGVFEGIPYEIKIAGQTLQYFIDLTENLRFKTKEIEVKIKKRKGKDHFFENADGTSFELMANKGVNFQFIDVPYIIVKDNAVELGLMLAVSLFLMTKELIQAIKDLAQSISDLVQAVTPNATLPPLPPLGAIIALVIKVVAQLAYTLAVLYAVIKLSQQLFELLFPKVRYYKACKVKELLTKGCEYLGYTFQSDLIDSLIGMTILPVPLSKKKKSIFDYIQNDLDFSFTKGYPTAQDTTPTLGSLFKEMEKMLYAETKVYNGVVRMERYDYWQTNANTNLIPSLAIQGERLDEYVLNTNEAWKRCYISYVPDYSDLHTINNFDPTDAEYSTEPLNVINPDLVSIKGYLGVQANFSLGNRKNSLNWIEKQAKGLFKVIDKVTSVFGGGTSLEAKINDRIGVLVISSQFYGVSKLLYLVGAKQPENYTDFISATALWNKGIYLSQIQLNNTEIREKIRTSISENDFISLLQNNFVVIEGEDCEVLDVEYFDEITYANISYKRKNNYAVGKVQTIKIN